MIVIKLAVKDDLLTGFHVSGHALFAEDGQDIVCAGVSSAVFLVANALTEVLSLRADILNETGDFQLNLPEKDDQIKAQDFLNAFAIHAKQLAKQYPQYITIDIGGF